MEEYQELLFRLASATGVSGAETCARDVAEEWLSQLGPCEVTALGSLICHVREASEDKPHVMLTAHMDQIGMIVTHIDEKGFLRVGAVGGMDLAVLPGEQVMVHTLSGDTYPGVVCTVPPHLSNPSDKSLPKIEDVSIDIGFSAEEAKKRVQPGDRVVCVSEPVPLLDGKVCAQAADNRAGCVAVMTAAKRLAKLPLNCSLSVLLSTMEEIGEQGAGTGARQLNPTHAIVVDVSFAHTPDARRSQCGEMGKGAMVAIAPVLDNAMVSKLQEVARKEKIPCQPEASGGVTGTDTDAVAIAGAGVRCGLLSVPLKYMHTPVEVIDLQDLDAVSHLISAFVEAEFGGAL